MPNSQMHCPSRLQSLARRLMMLGVPLGTICKAMPCPKSQCYSQGALECSCCSGPQAAFALSHTRAHLRLCCGNGRGHFRRRHRQEVQGSQSSWGQSLGYSPPVSRCLRCPCPPRRIFSLPSKPPSSWHAVVHKGESQNPYDWSFLVLEDPLETPQAKSLASDQTWPRKHIVMTPARQQGSSVVEFITASPSWGTPAGRRRYGMPGLV